MTTGNNRKQASVSRPCRHDVVWRHAALFSSIVPRAASHNKKLLFTFRPFSSALFQSDHLCPSPRSEHAARKVLFGALPCLAAGGVAKNDGIFFVSEIRSRKSEHVTRCAMKSATFYTFTLIALCQRCGQQVFHQFLYHTTRHPPVFSDRV